MTKQDKLDLIECVAEGVRHALTSVTLVEELEHPLTGTMVKTTTLATFKASAAKAARVARRAASVIALAACALTFGACATARAPSRVFTPTSLEPVKHAVEQAETHVKNATSIAQKLSDECAQKTAGWQAAYDSLQKELSDAYLATQAAQDQIAAKQTEVNTMTDAANVVSQQRDAAYALADKEAVQRHAWVKRFWIAAGAAGLLAAWVFRGLWIPLLAGI